MTFFSILFHFIWFQSFFVVVVDCRQTKIEFYFGLRKKKWLRISVSLTILPKKRVVYWWCMVSDGKTNTPCTPTSTCILNFVNFFSRYSISTWTAHQENFSSSLLILWFFSIWIINNNIITIDDYIVFFLYSQFFE